MLSFESTPDPGPVNRPARALPHRTRNFPAARPINNRNNHEARRYYAKEFLDVRRGRPTPYMDGLRFTPSTEPTTDADERMLSDEDLEQAAAEGQ